MAITAILAFRCQVVTVFLVPVVGRSIGNTTSIPIGRQHQRVSRHIGLSGIIVDPVGVSLALHRHLERFLENDLFGASLIRDPNLLLQDTEADGGLVTEGGKGSDKAHLAGAVA